MTITSVLTDPILNGVGIILAVIGLVMAYVFYRRGQRTSEPSWDVKAVNLIRHATSSLNGLRLTYKGRTVANVTVSRLIFWNNGRRTINREDVPPLDPLRIETEPDVRLLNISVIAVNAPANAVRILSVNDPHTALIDFDYLEKENGAVLQVVHDGVDSSSLKIAGTVKGARVAKRTIANAPPSSFFKPRIRSALVLAASYLVIATTLLCDLAYSLQGLSTGTPAFQVLPMILFSLIVVGSALVYIAGWKHPCPRGLESYLDAPTAKPDAT